MRVVFRTNLGSDDARPLGLDIKKCKSGATLDVDKAVADELVKRGIAATTEEAKSDPVISSAQGFPDEAKEDEPEPKPPVKAVPKSPEITAPTK